MAARGTKTPVLGITGTGGAGKSSLTDELIRRLRLDQRDALNIAVISIDPSKRKSGGALLGDRIRMNAIAPWSARRRASIMRSLATRDFGSEISAALPDVLAAVKVAGFDLVDRRDLRHRPGRRGDRAAGRRAGLRDDAGVRRREPAREDRHARLRRPRRDQQVRPQGRGRCAARRRQAGAAQPRGLRQAPRRRCRCSARWPAASTTTASPRSIRRCCRASPRWACRSTPGTLPRVAIAPQHAPDADRAAGARALSGRHRRRGARATSSAPSSQARLAREVQQLRESGRMLQPTANPDKTNAVGAVTALADEREARLDPRREQAARRLAGAAARPMPATSYVVTVRDKEIRTRAGHDDALGQQDPQGRAAALRGPRRDPELAAARQRARRVPVRRRHVPVQARGRGPDAHVRGRRRRLQDQHALQASLGQACRPSASRPRSIRSRSTATIRRSGPTSTARSAIPASRSRRSTT